MNNRRKLLVSLGVSAFMAPFGAFAQQAKIHRLGNLFYFSRRSFLDAGRYGALIKIPLELLIRTDKVIE